MGKKKKTTIIQPFAFAGEGERSNQKSDRATIEGPSERGAEGLTERAIEKANGRATQEATEAATEEPRS